MSQRKVAEVLLKYTVDDGSLNKAVQSNNRVAASFGSIDEAAKSLGIPVERLKQMTGETDQLAQKSGLLARVWDDNTRAANGFVTELEAIQRAESEVARQADNVSRALENQQKKQSVIRPLTGFGGGGIPEPPLSAFGVSDNSGVTRSLFSARQAAIALPGIGYGSPIVVGLRGLELVADKTGASVGKLATGVGITAAAIVVMAIALDRFNESVKGNKTQLDGALAAQQNYYNAVSRLTTEQVQAQIAELEQARPALEQQAAEARKALDSAFQQQSQGILGDPSARAQDLLGISAREQLKAAAESADKALQENIQTTVRYTQGINANAFATNDAVEAERQLEEARQKAAEHAVDVETQFQLSQTQLYVRGAAMTTEERNKEIASLEQTQNSLEAYKSQLEDQRKLYDENSDEYKELSAAINEAGLEISHTSREIDLLKRVISFVADASAEAARVERERLSAIQQGIAYQQQIAEQIRTSTPQQVEDRLYALQQEAAALKTFIPELEKLAPTSADAAKQLADARARLSDISSDYADQLIRVLPAALARARTSLQTEITSIETESAQRIDQILVDQTEKEAKALADRNDAYLAAEDKRGEALNDLAEKQAEARQKIERNANADITNAVRSRNALAAQLALEQKKQDLADLEEQGKAREKEIDKQLRKEKEVADTRYREQLDAAKSAADKAVNLERQKAQAEINQKVAAYNAQINALSVFTNSGTQLVYDFVNRSLEALTALANHQTTTPALPPYIEYTGLPPGTTLPPVSGYQGYYPDQIGRPYATGGDAYPGLIRVNEYGLESALNRKGQLMLLKEPMKIFSAPMTQRLLSGQTGGGSGVTVNVPIYGTQLRKRDIEAIVNDELDDALTKAGFD